MTHGGTLICLVGQWLGLTVEIIDPVGFEFHTTSINVLRAFADDSDFTPGMRVIERLNDTSHLATAEGLTAHAASVAIRMKGPRP